MTSAERSETTASTEAVWRAYHDRLYGFVSSRVGEASTAEDIVQDVFIKIHERIDTLQDPGKLQSWAYQIARNAIIDHLRSLKSSGEAEPDSLAAPEVELSDEVRRELAECMIPFIHCLPDHYRDAVLMAEIEGLKHQEVADREKISLPAAKARVQRGRQMLKQLLAECCEFEFDRRGQVIGYESRAPGGIDCNDDCGE